MHSVHSEVDIVNLALGRIAERPIVSLDDATASAKTAKARYPVVRDALLRRHRWNFAKARAQLAPLSAKPVFGAERAFTKPHDYIAAMGAWEGGWGEIAYSGHHDRLRVEGGKLMWPGATLYLYYIRRVEDVAEYDPLFVDALAWALAKELALLLANDGSKAQLAIEMLARTVREAKIANALETSPEPLIASEWLDARWAPRGRGRAGYW